MTHRWVVSLAVMLGSAATASAQDPGAVTTSVTLEEAIRRALDVQPAVVQARGTQRTSAAAKRQALGAFLPNISTSWGASRRWDSDQQRIDPTTGAPVSVNYIHTLGLAANVELFDGLRRFNTLRASTALQDAADASHINQRFQVTLTTKQLYYTAAANEELVAVAEAQVRRAQQQLQISVEKLRAGSATRSDSLRSTVDYGNSRIQLLQARANLATAQANLGRQIGVDEPVRSVPDTAIAEMPDTAGLRSAALQHAPTVLSAEAEERAARAQVVSARSQYLPTLTVSYNDNRQGTGWPEFVSFPGYSENYTWSFRVAWTLFNGFTRESQQVTQNVGRDVAVARAADERRRVSAALTQQLASLATSHEQIGIATTNLAAATEDLRVQQERYRVGAATILDLLTSQASLTAAAQNRVQARFNYLIALAQVEALIGRAL